MKVPFLNSRIKSEFESYLLELEGSVCASTEAARNDKDNRVVLFKSMYPLFALLRCLSDPTYARDPSRDAIFSELALKGDKNGIVSALRYFGKPPRFHSELMMGLRRRTFTAYFDELFSDSLLLLNSYYMNNYRGAFVAIRCMLEDIYRHLYYKDHPEEFSLLLNGNYTERELELRPVKFREFLRRATYLSKFHRITKEFQEPQNVVVDGVEREEAFTNLFALNDQLYGACSGHVHGSEFSTLNAFRTNLDLKINAERQAKVLAMTRDFVRMSVAFLVAAHVDQFLAANEYERSIILSGYTSIERGGLRRSLNI
jgi:hypothetical protein